MVLNFFLYTVGTNEKKKSVAFKVVVVVVVVLTREFNRHFLRDRMSRSFAFL